MLTLLLLLGVTAAAEQLKMLMPRIVEGAPVECFKAAICIAIRKTCNSHRVLCTGKVDKRYVSLSKGPKVHPSRFSSTSQVALHFGVTDRIADLSKGRMLYGIHSSTVVADL
jgi:hypothetical protein